MEIVHQYTSKCLHLQSWITIQTESFLWLFFEQYNDNDDNDTGGSADDNDDNDDDDEGPSHNDRRGQ